MSIATISAHSFSASHKGAPAVGGAPRLGQRPGATRLRLTRRGRAVLTALVAAPLAAALAFSALGATSAAAAPESGDGVAVVFETVMVAPGDSLWGIASEIAPSADPRDVVEELKRLNALESAQLVAGQRLAIPAQYAAGK